MIIVNGTIELKTKTQGGGIDPDTGFPVPFASAAWGDPIPCQYYANRYNNLGRVDGEHFTVASYVVLVDSQAIGSEQLRLKDRSGAVVGEFSIIQVEPLDAVQELRILI
jgi:hypothetical protein